MPIDEIRWFEAHWQQGRPAFAAAQAASAAELAALKQQQSQLQQDSAEALEAACISLRQQIDALEQTLEETRAAQQAQRAAQETWQQTALAAAQADVAAYLERLEQQAEHLLLYKAARAFEWELNQPLPALKSQQSQDLAALQTHWQKQSEHLLNAIAQGYQLQAQQTAELAQTEQALAAAQASIQALAQRLLGEFQVSPEVLAAWQNLAAGQHQMALDSLNALAAQARAEAGMFALAAADWPQEQS